MEARRDCRRKLIVALDLSSRERALRLVDRLRPAVGLFKIGLQLFAAQGPRLVREVAESGASVFLDLKLHDIPNTVAQAAVEAGRMGVCMLTLHTLGGEKMLRQARESLQQAAAAEGWKAPALLGVTILTSLSESEMQAAGIEGGAEAAVLRLARLARRTGLDGVVASPRELEALNRPGLQDLVLVTPGIRPAASAPDDQARTAEPGWAIERGADYLVVGRPITGAADPLASAQAIVREMARAKIRSG